MHTGYIKIIAHALYKLYPHQISITWNISVILADHAWSKYLQKENLYCNFLFKIKCVKFISKSDSCRHWSCPICVKLHTGRTNPVWHLDFSRSVMVPKIFDPPHFSEHYWWIVYSILIILKKFPLQLAESSISLHWCVPKLVQNSSFFPMKANAIKFFPTIHSIKSGPFQWDSSKNDSKLEYYITKSILYNQKEPNGLAPI